MQHITVHRLLLDFTKAVLCCRCFSIRKRKERGRSISVTCYFPYKTCWQKILLKKTRKRKGTLCKCVKEKNGQFYSANKKNSQFRKSCIKYYSNHLCVRNLGIMSLHFTNTGPEPAPVEWVGTSATDSSRVPTGSVASLRVPSKFIHPVLSAYLPSHQHIKHLPHPPCYPTPPGLQLRKVFHFW